MSNVTVTPIARYETYGFTERMYTIACHKCGILYAFPDSFDDRRRNDGGTFYCPNGHGACYNGGKTEAERLKRELDNLRSYHAETRADLAVERKKHSATKGQVTKLRNRAAAGMCPDCRRTFADYAAHMRRKHNA